MRVVGGTENKSSTKCPVQCPVRLQCLNILKLDLPSQTELQTNFFVDSSLNLNGQSGIIRHLR